ncbi:MAG: hypothetical protein IH939_16810 [Acidobacteria bacterium]|nr:hypothetical protein [Acidobacteriota bacterium]
MPVRILSLLIALVLVNVLLLAPQWLLAGRPGPTWIALEACLVVGLFAVLPRGRWSAVLATVTALALVLLSVLAFADVAAREILARPLNLYLDLHLLSAVYNLMTGTLGSAIAGLVVLCVVLGAAVLAWFLAFLLSPIEVQKGRRIIRAVGVALIAFFCIAFASHTMLGRTRRMALPAVQITTDQVRYVFLMLNERERFAAELEAAPAGYASLPHPLLQLQGVDVLLAFLESYGVSALYDPRYAPVIRPRLEDLAARMADAGLHLTTGTLVAPTQGGQSWLSHLSLLSGMWVDNQLRYDLLLTSGRETLINDFSRAGHRTVALLPAITLAWPEGERLGYDEILAQRDIDYAGPALNWVTMPDQFTWSVLEHTIRAADDVRPVFAEVGLISSHAPWTPILPVLDWASIGDGSVFARWEHAGERPDDLWQDWDRVREHYALSVDYAINTMIGYAERYVDDRTLLIVLGDHQPAPMITGDNSSRAVPVHVISGDPALLQPFLDWGFKRGALPDPDQPAPRMDAFRDWFVRAFSEPAAAPGTKATVARE